MLEHLLVAENQLESVPDSLGKLRKLKVLDLSENLIGALPHACSMESLQEARLQGNALQVVPDCLVGQALKSLQMSRNQVSELPVLNPGALQLVDAENNSIVALPKIVPVTLTHLYLGANPLRIDPPILSAWLQRASELQYLDISLSAHGAFGPWFTVADGTCQETLDATNLPSGFQVDSKIPSCGPRIETMQWAGTGMTCKIGDACSFTLHIYDNQQQPLRTTLPDPHGTNAISMRIRQGKQDEWQVLHDNRDGTYSTVFQQRGWLQLRQVR